MRGSVRLLVVLAVALAGRAALAEPLCEPAEPVEPGSVACLAGPPLSPPPPVPAVVDCNDDTNPLVADVVGVCDMPELLSASAEPAWRDDGPSTPATPPACSSESCSPVERPLGPRGLGDLDLQPALPFFGRDAVPPYATARVFDEPPLRVAARGDRLERPPRRG